MILITLYFRISLSFTSTLPASLTEDQLDPNTIENNVWSPSELLVPPASAPVTLLGPFPCSFLFFLFFLYYFFWGCHWLIRLYKYVSTVHFCDTQSAYCMYAHHPKPNKPSKGYKGPLLVFIGHQQITYQTNLKM